MYFYILMVILSCGNFLQFHSHIFVFRLFLLVRILLGQTPQKYLGCPTRMLAKAKQYMCTYCDKAFKHRCVLKSHLHINTGEKLYQVSQCERCFSKKGKSYIQYKNTHRRKNIYVQPL